MLQTLHIRDLALVGEVELRFDRGLNVLSGATGGGKSLVVTALKLLRGERAAGSLVRHGADELRIDGEFVLADGERTAPVLEVVREVCGRIPEEGVLVVTRIVDSRGRSKVRIDGRPATLHDLRAVCAHLLEIHGQGESQALMRAEMQAETLDSFAGTADVRRRFAAVLQDARAARARLEGAAADAGERLERAEFLRFQIAEMDAIGLEEGEVERVESEHRLLSHLESMRSCLAVATGALQDDEANAADLLGRAGRALQEGFGIDERLAEAVELVVEAQAQVAEAARMAQSRLADLDLDPARLGEVEERLATLRRALSRFGPTEADFRDRRAEAAAELAALDDLAAGPGALEAEWEAARASLDAAARKLCRARRKAAPAFVRAVEGELADLGMVHTRVRVSIPERPPTGLDLLTGATAHGPVPLDIEVRINPGEPFRSMRETASGGETARIVLAIKKTLADQDRVPFVVFDEIDAEIGGRLGLQVGSKLEAVAANHQLLIVTHLPQVAAFAAAHFRVDKEIRQDRTWTQVVRLDPAAAEEELAAMASGDDVDAAAVAEARRLVARARGLPTGA